MLRSSQCLKLLAAAAVTVPLVSAIFSDQSPAAPAVSGTNTRFSVEGGSYDEMGAGLLQGSLTQPMGYAFGFQVDGIAGQFDEDFLGGGALHVFTRVPSSYLLGVYGSYHTWNSIDITRLAAEAELYMGKFTASGIAGWERIDVPGTRRGLTVLTKDDEHFFTEFDLNYYATDNLRLSLGYHYESVAHLAVAKLEYLTRVAGAPASFFATAYVGEDNHTRVTGGIRFYFGANPNMSLIRRHRTQDPIAYNPVWPEIVTANPTSTPTQNICPAEGNFLSNSFPGCTCPNGNPPSDIGDGEVTCERRTD